MKNFFIYIFTILGVFILLALFFSRDKSKIKEMNQNSTSSAVLSGKYQSPPKMTIDPDKKYSAGFTTSKGNFTVDLFAKETPVTVNNFVFLARDNFYSGVVFHRIIKDFMVQSGDPNGDGTGGPGYKFDDEPITRDYKRGIVAMANSGPNTNGSQFFIMLEDNPGLPKKYTIFGQVISGMDVVEKITIGDVMQRIVIQNLQ